LLVTFAARAEREREIPSKTTLIDTMV